MYTFSVSEPRTRSESCSPASQGARSRPACLSIAVELIDRLQSRSQQSAHSRGSAFFALLCASSRCILPMPRGALGSTSDPDHVLAGVIVGVSRDGDIISVAAQPGDAHVLHGLPVPRSWRPRLSYKSQVGFIARLLNRRSSTAQLTRLRRLLRCQDVSGEPHASEADND